MRLHVAIQHTAGTFNQVIESAQRFRLCEEHGEIRNATHDSFDAISGADDLLSGEFLDY